MARSVHKKGILVLLLILVLFGFWYIDVSQYLTLSYIKSQQEQFHALYAEHGIFLVAAYMLIYIAVTALSLPGAAVMSLAGAALFGFWVTLFAVSFASSIGATLACFAARFVLRDWVQKKFGDKLKKINAGVSREGALYLFTLRLVPAFPFFLINLTMGLTPMRLLTFYWVSQLGMLPGTIVYVNAAKELGKIDSLAGILSPQLILSFILLGIFPLLAKKFLTLVAKK